MADPTGSRCSGYGSGFSLITDLNINLLSIFIDQSYKKVAVITTFWPLLSDQKSGLNFSSFFRGSDPDLFFFSRVTDPVQLHPDPQPWISVCLVASQRWDRTQS